jgi:hypothetical protein
VAAVEGLAKRPGEDELGFGPCIAHGEPTLKLAHSMRPQDGDDERREVYRAAASVRLRLYEAPRAAHALPGVLHVDAGRLQVNVGPLQPEQFPLPHPGHDREGVQGLVFVARSRGEERSDLLLGQRPDLGALRSRGVDGVCRIAIDDLPPDGLSQRPVEDGVQLRPGSCRAGPTCQRSGSRSWMSSQARWRGSFVDNSNHVRRDRRRSKPPSSSWDMLMVLIQMHAYVSIPEADVTEVVSRLGNVQPID